MKITSICLAIILGVSGWEAAIAQTPVPAGPVSGTWTAAGSPYYILGDITLASGESLVIEPGVWVEFQGHYSLGVAGSLFALGTNVDTIMFTINDSTGFHNLNIPDGGWHGIRFGMTQPGTDSSRLSFCVFAFAKAVGDVFEDKYGGAVRATDYDDIVINHSVFFMNAAQEGGGAVGMSSSNITLEYNQYWHCRSSDGGAIAIHNSAPIIRTSYFVDNHAEGSGGGIAMAFNSNAMVSTNLFAGNFATYGGGIQCFTNCSPLIRNNLLYSNVAYEEGGALDLENNCQATLINNTIVDNHALFGGGLDVEVNTSPVIRNTIFWGNHGYVDGPEIHLFSEDSDPDIYYCDIEGGSDSIGLWYGGSIYLTYTGTYENNLDEDPDFVDMGDYYYLLNDGSPCIDAGDPDPVYNDLEDPQAPGMARWPSKGTLRNDMGAYGGPYPFFIEIITGIDESVKPLTSQNPISGFHCYPNPAGEIVNCRFSIVDFQYLTAEIIDLQGKVLAEHVIGELQPGEYTVEFNTLPLSAGVYFCILHAGKYHKTQKLVVK